MSVNSLNATGALSGLFSPRVANQETTDKSDSFMSALTDALQPIAQTEAQDNAGNIDLLTGDLNAIHTTLIDAEKADIALQLTLQIRNKVIDAYSEIMRMSV